MFIAASHLPGSRLLVSATLSVLDAHPVVFLCHGDPAAVDLYMLQEFIDVIGAGVSQLKSFGTA